MTPEQAMAEIYERYPYLRAAEERILYLWEPEESVLVAEHNACLEPRRRVWREGIQCAYAIVASPEATAQTIVFFKNERGEWQANPVHELHLIRHLVDALAATQEQLGLFLRHRPSGIMPIMRELDAATARAEAAEQALAALQNGQEVKP